MPRSNVKVVLRTRPCASEQQNHLQIDTATKAVSIISAGRSGLAGLPSSSDKAGPPQRYLFKFDSILHEASQEDVFEVCAAGMVRQALEGYNGCIMCYGQTGAGKTFTMSGNTASYEQRGLIPRVLATLLSSLRATPGLASWSLSLSYLEVYNDVLYDLLDINTSPSELTLYEDGGGQLQVSGARKVSVTSEAEALALFFEGEANRVIGQHQLNRESSRSHSVFMAHTTCVQEGGDGTATSSKLCLVDLAGSERVAKTGSEGLLLREAGAINKSLALLEQVVLAAAAVGRGAWSHVPYRTCKLTHVLKDCLGGNCATLLVANVWGEAAQLEETLSTCRFASRMAALEVDISRNTAAGGGGGRAASARVKALEREVQELKEELAMMEMMHTLAATQQQQQQQSQQSQQSQQQGDGSSGSSGSSSASSGGDKYAPYSLAQRQRLRQQVVAWLQQEQQQLQHQADSGLLEQQQQQQQQQQSGGGSLAPLPLHNVRQLRELLWAYKAIVQDMLSSRPASVSSSAVSGLTNSGAMTTTTSAGAAAGGWGLGDGSSSGLRSSWPPPEQQQRQQQQQPESDLVCDGDDGLSPASDLQLQQQAYGVVGAAPDDARPSSYGGISNSSTGLGGGLDGVDADAHDGSRASGAGPGSHHLLDSTAARSAAAAAAGGDREAALVAYRAGPGAAAAQLLNDNHSRLKGAKRRRQLLAEQLNGLKAELDDLLQQQHELKQQRLQGAQAAAAVAAAAAEPHHQQQQQHEQQVAHALAAAQVLGPEEYRLTTVIREVKAQYRDAHAELQLVKDEVSYTSGLLDTCRAELVAGFEAWYAAAAAPTSHHDAAAAGARGGVGSSQQQQPYQQPEMLAPSCSRPDSSISTSTAGYGSAQPSGFSDTGSWAPPYSAASAASAAGGASPSGRSRMNSMSSSGGGGGSPNQQRQRSTPPLASLVGGLSSNSSSGSGGLARQLDPRFIAAGSSSIGSGVLSVAGSLSSASGYGGAGGGDAGAAASFYAAQQQALLLSRAGKGAGSNSGSVRKHRLERGTFSLASRSSAAEVVVQDRY